MISLIPDIPDREELEAERLKDQMRANSRTRLRQLREAQPKLKTCKCGNLIALAHGEDECAVCFMKMKWLWK